MRKSVALLIALVVLCKLGQSQSAAIADSAGPKTYALILGISEYQYIQPLNFADQDAMLFRNFLRSAGGGNLAEEDIFCLLNEEAKAGNFWVKGMNWLRSKKMKKGDRLFIYMAGHGDAINQDEYFFLTYECNPAGDKNNYLIGGNIQLYNLKSRIGEMVRNGVEVLLIMDACRSNELPGGSNGQQILNAAISEKQTGEMILLATGAGQESLEDASIGTGHGLFTYYLVDGLSGLADSTGDNNRKITLGELKQYITSNVPQVAQQRYNRKQEPFICCEENVNRYIANVDSGFSSRWARVKMLKDLTVNEFDALVRGSMRTRGDLAPADSQHLATYRLFLSAIKQMRLAGTDSSAEFFYSRLQQQDSAGVFTQQARLTLAAEYINYAQTKISLYLQGKDASAVQRMRSQLDEEDPEDVAIILDRVDKIAKMDFSQTGQYLERAIGLLEMQDSVLVRLLQPRVYFFRAHGFFDKGNRRMDYNQAIRLAHLALGSDTTAAYTFNTLASLYIQASKPDSALFFAAKAQSLAPKWRYPYLNMAYASQLLNQRADAIYFFRQAIAVDPNNADALVDLGRYFQRNKQYDSALLMYNRALKLEPQNVYAHNNLGWIYKSRRQYNPALEHFRKSIELDPRFFSAYNGMSKVFMAMRQNDSARFYFEKALERHPDKMMASNYLGDFFKEQKMYDSAFFYYQQAVRFDPEDHAPLINIGKTYFELKKFDSALQYYRRALQVQPDNDFAYNQMGLFFKQRKQYDSAAVYFLKALDSDPNSPSSLNNLGVALYEQGKHDSALIFYYRALNLDKANAVLCNNIALAHKERFRIDSAKTYFAAAVSLNPSLVSASHNLGWLYREQMKYDSAKMVFRAALELNPFNPEAMSNLVQLYKYLNEYDSARYYFQQNIERFPGNPSMLNNFGIFYYDMKKYDSAVLQYKRALALDSVYTIAWHNLGTVYNEMSWYDSAVICYRKALQLDPTYFNAAFNLGMAFYNWDRLDSAIRYLRLSSQLEPKNQYFNFYLACSYSLKNQKDSSLLYLRKAFENGFTGYYEVLHDLDLRNVRTRKEFDALIKEFVPQKHIDLYLEERRKELEQNPPPPEAGDKKKKGNRKN